MIEISAKKKINDVDKVATITYDFGENLNDMTSKFGEEVVFTNARGSFKITAQAAMRRYLAAGLDEGAIQEKMAMWKPGVALERSVDPVASLIRSWDTMSDEKKAEVMKKLKGLK